MKIENEAISASDRQEFNNEHFKEARQQGLYFSIVSFFAHIAMFLLSYIGIISIEMRYLSLIGAIIYTVFIPISYLRLRQKNFEYNKKEILYKYAYIYVLYLWAVAGSVVITGYIGFIIYFFIIMLFAFFLTDEVRNTLYFYIISTAIFSVVVILTVNDYYTKKSLIIATVLINLFSFYINRFMYRYKFENFIIRKRLEEKNDQLENANYRLKKDFDKIADIDKKLKINIQKVMNFLNSTDQGFLSFGEDFIIDEEVSDKCKEIFGQNIAKKNILKLLPIDESIDIVQQIFLKLIKKPTRRIKKLYIPLLPEKLKINNIVVKIDYKIASYYGKIKITMILSDITEVIELEHRVVKEKQVVDMILNVVKYRNEFNDILKQFSNFYKEIILKIFDTPYDEKLIYQALQDLHTLKGNFSQLQMRNTAKKIHYLETVLIGYYEKKQKEILLKVNCDEIPYYPSKDVRRVREHFENIISDDNILEVHSLKLEEIERILKKETESNTTKKVLQKINELKKKNFKILISIYSNYIFNLAKQRKKDIADFIIEGDDIFVDIENYKEFGKVLVHIYRNVVEHAFYDEGVFIDMKHENIIKTRIKKQENLIFISIEDNGKGIDIDEIKMRALEKGYYNEEDLAIMGKAEILEIIFNHGFSTSDIINEISGRGIGLNALRDAVLRLKGTIKVYSKIESGTKFEIYLPYIN